MLQVAYIAAGAGNLYCGACAADLSLNRALRRCGVATLMLPLYTPLRDSGDLVYPRVFLGGVSTWLRHKPAPISWTAPLLAPLLDSAPILRLASRFAVRTDPHDLGALTVSVLRGLRSPHAAELRRVASWLAGSYRADVIHLSNSLLSPLARVFKSRLRCPVVCSVQGEEHFVAALPGRYRNQAVALLRENMKSVDEIIRPTATGADEVGRLLGRIPSSFSVVPPAVEMPAGDFPPRRRSGVILGYLSAIRPEKGLDLLVSALADLVPRVPAPLEFRIAGQVADAAFWQRQQRLLPELVPAVHSTFLGELDAVAKADFLHQCHIFVMPTRVPEARGLAALEAMAAGCAVIAPRHGIFSELLAEAPQLLYEPGDVRSLSETIFRLLRNPVELEHAGEVCAKSARNYAADLAAQKLKAIYQRLTAAPAAAPVATP